MTQVVHVSLLPYVDPASLKPLAELVLRFDRFYDCLCDNCKNHDKGFVTQPCYFRKNFAWKSCRLQEPIARNPFLAERVLALTKHGLSLDEAIGFYRELLGDVFEPKTDTILACGMCGRPRGQKNMKEKRL